MKRREFLAAVPAAAIPLSLPAMREEKETNNTYIVRPPDNLITIEFDGDKILNLEEIFEGVPCMEEKNYGIGDTITSTTKKFETYAWLKEVDAIITTGLDRYRMKRYWGTVKVIALHWFKIEPLLRMHQHTIDTEIACCDGSAHQHIIGRKSHYHIFKGA
jgi:hypothetical protein